MKTCENYSKVIEIIQNNYVRLQLIDINGLPLARGDLYYDIAMEKAPVGL